MSETRQFVSTFRSIFLNAGVFSLAINIALLAPSLYMLQVFDRVLASRSDETLLMLSIATAGALLTALALDYLRNLLLQRAGALLDRTLGRRVLVALIRNASNIQRRENLHGLRDVAQLRGFLTGAGVISLFDAPWGLIFVVLIFLFHPLMGIVAVGGMLVLLVLALFNERMNRKKVEAVQDRTRRAGQYIDKGMANADVLNSMGMTAPFVERWHTLNDEVIASSLATSRIMSGVTSLSRFVRQFIQVAVMGTGAWLVIDQHVTPGIMIASTILLGRALAPVESVIGNWNNFVLARAAWARMKPFLDEDETAAPTSLPEPHGELSVEAVTLAGRTAMQTILRQVSFQLPAGQSLAIVGPSASGKSSLARLLAGVWAPTHGTVRVDGADVRQLVASGHGRHIGYLPQDVELFPGTIAENIARLGTVNAERVIAAAQRAQVHELILRLPEGYDTRISQTDYILSGGQMQRIGLARALYDDPALVILDEPNANLDADGEASLVRCIRQITHDGVTVVMVTHKPSLLDCIDRVLVLREGRVEGYGPREELLARIAPQRVAPVTAVAPVAPVPPNRVQEA
ncbi:type I secretion system permease/ATPase [Aromatoleum toluclasticum]|uniref:type I secretion system permease/ATPase n=1 Tax=Aromatoleum toluclasticum TaxID=92003 RepID=UPI001D188422|nr:type I secretion system permease/ATPase [Aromatoleum toluclasticum]MCC4114380.1 type I secretion system permease/ATPase [Aromatoleum toluclasticum]